MTLLGLVLLSGIVLVLLRRVRRSPLSAEWHRSTQRAEWRQGIDGPAVDWSSAPRKFAAYRDRGSL